MTDTRELLEHLRAFDTPTICNALELVVPERRTTGFTVKPFQVADPELGAVCGFARTATIRAMTPLSAGPGEERDRRLAYYAYVADGPHPVVMVIEDLDPEPGFGAFWGEVNSAIHKALGCLGCVTNGSMRDLDGIAPEFQILAGAVAPSHAFVHVEAFDLPVRVHGMAVEPGDIVHADRHGAVVIPERALPELADAIDLLIRRERHILHAVRDESFSLERLRQALLEADGMR